MSLSNISAVISLVLSCLLFVPYYSGIIKGETKPHILTWATWSVLTGLGFILSYSNGGGPGSFNFALQSLLCFTIVLYSFFQKEKNITNSDWITFCAAIFISILYFFSKDALLSIIFATIIDSLGYIPTFRKSYLSPQEEPTLTYILNSGSWFFSIGGLKTFSLVTLIFPTTLIVVSSSLVVFLIIRKKALLK